MNHSIVNASPVAPPYFELVNPREELRMKAGAELDEAPPVICGYLSYTCPHGNSKMPLLYKLKENLEVQQAMDDLKEFHEKHYHCRCSKQPNVVRNPLPRGVH